MFFPLESFVPFVVKFLSNEQGSHSKGTNLVKPESTGDSCHKDTKTQSQNNKKLRAFVSLW
jgi:hypothetical protein